MRFKVTETLSEIKSYIKKHHKFENETDDTPIPTKSKDRVMTYIAEGVKKTLKNPLPKGACCTCARESDRLVPVVMKVCKACAKRFERVGKKIKIMRIEFSDDNCDNCLGRTFTVYHINPFICVKCSSKIGRRHKYGINDMRYERMKINARKPLKVGNMAIPLNSRELF